MKKLLAHFCILFLLFFTSLAYAESLLNLEIERLTPITGSSPLSASAIIYEVRFQCSAVDEVECKDTLIKIGPLPHEIEKADVGEHPLIESSFFIRGSKASDDGFITINLKAPVWAGSSIVFDILMRTENGRTPTGFTWDVIANATASNANTVTSTTDGKVYANADILITKQVAPEVPPVDYVVRYLINACDGTSNELYGHLYLENGVVTDNLPDQVEYVASSSGGVYDSAMNTVTWAVPDLGSKSCNAGANFWIDVKFPSAIFGASAPKIIEATNNVKVTGVPYGETEELSDFDILKHRFLDEAEGTGAFSKVSYTPLPVSSNRIPVTYPGDWMDDEDGRTHTEAHWNVRFYNSSIIPLTVEVNDRLPCAYATNDRLAHTSPLDWESLCTSPSFITETIYLEDPVKSAFISNTFSPKWTSNNGSNGFFVHAGFSGGSGIYLKPLGLPAGDIIAEIYYPPVVIPPNERRRLPFTIAKMNGYVPVDDPNRGAGESWIDETVITNIADYKYYIGTDPSPDWSKKEAKIQVEIPEVTGGITKRIVPHNKLISLRAYNSGAVPMEDAIVTDLLPSGVTFDKLIKVEVGLAPTADDRHMVNLEVIDNYNNTGRQLVRFTLKPGLQIPSPAQVKYANSMNLLFSVKGMVGAEAPIGEVINYAQLHLKGAIKIGACLIKANSASRLSRRTVDELDLDGDGLTESDIHCEASSKVVNRTSTSFMLAEKYVKGDLDSSFETFPTVGSMSSASGTGEFELRLRNSGNVDLVDIVVYDFLPRIGDKGVKLTTIARKSEFTPVLTSIPAITGTSGAIIEYSTSLNPCRGELNQVALNAWPAACDNDWSTTVPSPLADTTALRISSLGDLPADPQNISDADNRVIHYDVSGPNGLEPGKVTWNSFAVAGSRAGGGKFLPFEPPKVGLAIPQTDVEIAKKVNGLDSVVVELGAIVDYKITVKHGTTIIQNTDGSVDYVNPAGSAPSTARDVVIKDVIPAGLQLVENSSTPMCGENISGSFDEATSIWTIGDIQPSESYSLCYKAKVIGAGVHINLAEVFSTGANSPPDIDSTPGNIGETPIEDDEADAEVTVLMPGIDLEKEVLVNGVWLDADSGTAELPVLLLGNPIPYRFVVTNTGETWLRDVTVTDPLIDSKCTIPVFDLAPPAENGGVVDIRIIECTWPYGWNIGLKVNTADVTSTTDGGEVLVDTDTVQVEIVVTGDHLAIDKSDPVNADNDASGDYSEGDVLTYTVTATNFGGTELTNVIVNDAFITPNSITCASVVSGGTCVLIGTYTITSEDIQAGTIRNTANSISNEAPNITTEVITVVAPPNPSLAVVKSDPENADNDGSGDITKDDVLTYTITATNNGAAVLTNVVVTDVLITPSSKTCATLAPLETCILVGTHTVTLAEANAGSLTNTASGSSNEVSVPVVDSVTSPITQPPATSTPEEIPTLTEYALMLLSILLFISSQYMLRRRRLVLKRLK